MGDRTKTILAYTGAVLLVLIAVSAFIGYRQDEYVPATESQIDVAETNTLRNSFLSGCTEGGEATTAECTCMVNKLESMYPDFYTNDARIDRISKQGYNTTETDQLIKCVDEREV